MSAKPPDFFESILQAHEMPTMVFEPVRDPASGEIVDLRVLYRNAAARSISRGYHSRVNEGECVRATLGDDIGERIFRFNLEILKTGEARRQTVNFTHLGLDQIIEVNAKKCGDYVLSTYWDVTEKAKAEAELEENARRLDIATDAAGIGVWERDVESGLSYWDARTREIHGLPADDDSPITNEDTIKLIHPDDWRELSAHSDEVAARPLFNSRMRAVRPDGEVRWVQLHSRQVDDARGRRMVGVCWDVTEEARAEEKLAEFARRLDIATDAAGIGVWEHYFGTSVAYWDRRTREIHGLPADADDCIQLSDIEGLMHPDDRASSIEMRKSTRNEPTVSFRHRIVRPSGETRWVEVFARRVQDHLGERLVGVCWDVTEKRIADEKLEEFARRLDIATDAAAIGVWEHNLDTDTVHWDARTCAIHGLNASNGGSFPGSMAARFVHPDDWQSIVSRGDVERQEPSFSSRHRIVRKGGEIRWVQIHSRLADDQRGRRYVGVCWDVTDEVHAAEELARRTKEAQAASEAKSRFLASMSHEIRTPMNGVLGMAQALALTEVSDKQREMIDIVLRSGEALLALLNDILDISRIEAGAMTIDASNFNLGALARDVGALFAAKAQAAGLTFAVDVDPAVEGVVKGDPLRVRQVLNNLISNAIKFTEEGGVTVRLRRGDAPAEVVIEVHDTGVGISPEKLKTVFDTFVQVDDSNTRRFGGSGLGLSIVRSLAAAMGGDASAQSVPGEGSTFAVRLPLRPVAEAAERAALPAPRSAAG